MDINHTAALARIGLGEKELKGLEKELAAILDFVGKLKEMEVVGVEPMSGGTTLFNAIRDDELKLGKAEERDRILANAPKRRGDYVEVKAIFK